MMGSYFELTRAGYRECREGPLVGTPEGYLYGRLAEALERVVAERDAWKAKYEALVGVDQNAGS